MPDLKSYTMDEGMQVTRGGVALVKKWLAAQPKTLGVIDTEEDKSQQAKGIDLIWKTESGDITIEVKTDRQYEKGNFFLETISNEGKGTPGAFLYTEADLLFYCFSPQSVAYIFSVKEVRLWFLENLDQFKERKTQTRLANGEKYTTVGRLVNRHYLLSKVKSVREIKI